jgi:WD40-like Beta Propeller Repeat
MTDRHEDLPQAVRDQLERARRAVPPGDLLDAAMAEVRSTQQRRVRPVWLRGALLGVGAAAILLLVTFVVAGSLGRPPASSGSSSPSPTASGQMAVIEEQGLRLELRTDRTTYTEDEPISVSATLTYLGPEQSVTLYHGNPMITFDLVELSGQRVMMGTVDAVCRQTVATRGQPISIPFVKGASWTADDPNAAFYQDWIADPVLQLPVGSWNVLAEGQFSLDGCGNPINIGQKLTVTVTPPPGVTPTPTPSPTSTPSQPELRGTLISSAHDMRIDGWSPDGRWLAAHAGSGTYPGGEVRIFDASGAEVGSLAGDQASWVSADVLAVLQYPADQLGMGTVILHHVSTGVDETVPGSYTFVAGSGTGRLALSIADPAGEHTTFKLFGSDTVYPGYPIQADAWDPTGRWLAVREVQGSEGGPGYPYPLALLDAQTGQLVETRYRVGATFVFFNAGGQMLTTVFNPTAAASPVQVVALVDLARPREAATILAAFGPSGPQAGPALLDGRWLVTEGESQVLVWDPSTGATMPIARGSAGVSPSGIVAVMHGGSYGDESVGLELNGAAAGVKTIGIAGLGFGGPAWSPAGDRLAYVSGTDGGDLYLLIP